ncbi:hypothetical protein [Legionella sp.]|uniref:hypothetical protein n=1 Tax=Legionella sp. TaxID=459 RepID=UPI003C859DA7
MGSFNNDLDLNIVNNVYANGFELGFCHTNGSLGIFVDSDKLPSMAISDTSPFSKEVLLRLEEFQALIFFKDFENSSLFKDIESKQTKIYSIRYLTKIIQRADFVLSSDQANEQQKKNALKFLNTLESDVQVNWMPK